MATIMAVVVTVQQPPTYLRYLEGERDWVTFCVWFNVTGMVVRNEVLQSHDRARVTLFWEVCSGFGSVWVVRSGKEGSKLLVRVANCRTHEDVW